MRKATITLIALSAMFMSAGEAQAGCIGTVINGVCHGTVTGGRAGTPVYKESECIGPVVNGVCRGTVIDTDPGRQRCYGQMINGRCTGPQF